ncbi:peptidylprolyl isomerase [Planosporangium thailandense]|uniref:Peptidyl-prolyl cis-trans isomerase n=1 Tax=Planosporangium thailandense TaxID=765197 RepID=A0ABX0XU22_9ACTN|nr:peptidylprolyl isomerase [Planosporangium thailandense]NJC68847.1 peptidylprolyl isomerase [Planosporangium thailandense]
MSKSGRSSRRSPRRSSWGGAAVVVALLLVGGAGTAVALTRNRSDAPASTGSTAAPTVQASPGATSVGDGLDPSAGSGAAPKRSSTPTTAPATPAAVTAQCQYVPTSGSQSIPLPNSRASLPAHPHVTLTTNFGAIGIDLAANAAPCTVNSFLTLAHKGFFTGTQCHRLTTDALYVLQCGDPSGTGQGGPGYQFNDENLPTKSKPAYPRGTLAMANSGPGTNGSQFFLVYKDSAIDPNYSVFGRITSGLSVLDKIAALGTDDSNGPGDGRPKREVTITQVG